MRTTFTSANQFWVSHYCDSCPGRLISGSASLSNAHMGDVATVSSPRSNFILHMGLWLSLNCFSQHHGSFLPAIWPSYAPVTLCESASSLCSQGNAAASSLKPPCTISDTSSPWARSAWASQAIKIFQDSRVSGLSLSSLNLVNNQTLFPSNTWSG